MADLTANLIGNDSGLEDALNSVADASSKLAGVLDNLDDELDGLSEGMSKTKSVAESAGNSIEEAADDASAAAPQFDKLGDNVESVSIDAEQFTLAIGQAGNSAKEAGNEARFSANGFDQLQDQMTNATGASGGLAGALTSLNAVNGQVAGTSRVAASGIDEMGDEAGEAAGQLVGAASASELLSLQSSALSINVGFFTIALRNLTTQIPLLVTSLGNLTAAFTGLASAVAGVGIGGFALALGGALAKAEEGGANLNDMESVMQALSSTSQELQERLLAAFRPVIEAEGAISVFEGAMDSLVTVVHSFSQALSAAFTGDFTTDAEEPVQNFQETLAGLGDAVTENIDAVTQAFGDLVILLGNDLVNLGEDIMEGLPGFLRQVALTTEDMINVIGSATDGLGAFIHQFTLLGRAIAAGIAPVLAGFFKIFADIVDSLIKTEKQMKALVSTTGNGIETMDEAKDALSGFRLETIASAAKVGALLLAINRLASIMGSVVTPIAAAGASLASFFTAASGPLSGFLITLDNLGGVVGRNIGGIGRLANAFELILPPIGESTSALTALRKRLGLVDAAEQEAQSETERLTNEMYQLRAAMGMVEDEADETSSSLSNIGNTSISLSSLTGIRDKFNELRNAQDGIFAGFVQDISNVTGGSEALTEKLFELSYSLMQMGPVAQSAGVGLTVFTSSIQSDNVGILQSLSYATTAFTDKLSENIFAVRSARATLKTFRSSLSSTGSLTTAVSDSLTTLNYAFAQSSTKANTLSGAIKNTLRTALINVAGAFLFAGRKARLFAVDVGQGMSEASEKMSELKGRVGDVAESTFGTRTPLTTGMRKTFSKMGDIADMGILGIASTIEDGALSAFGSAFDDTGAIASIKSIGSSVKTELTESLLQGSASVWQFGKSLKGMGGIAGIVGQTIDSFFLSMIEGESVMAGLKGGFETFKTSLSGAIPSISSLSTSIDNMILSMIRSSGATRTLGLTLNNIQGNFLRTGSAVSALSAGLRTFRAQTIGASGVISAAKSSLSEFRAGARQTTERIGGPLLGAVLDAQSTFSQFTIGNATSRLGALQSRFNNFDPPTLVDFPKRLGSLGDRLQDTNGYLGALGSSLRVASVELSDTGNISRSLGQAFEVFSIEAQAAEGSISRLTSGLSNAGLNMGTLRSKFDEGRSSVREFAGEALDSAITKMLSMGTVAESTSNSFDEFRDATNSIDMSNTVTADSIETESISERFRRMRSNISSTLIGVGSDIKSTYADVASESRSVASNISEALINAPSGVVGAFSTAGNSAIQSFNEAVQMDADKAISAMASQGMPDNFASNMDIDLGEMEMGDMSSKTIFFDNFGDAVQRADEIIPSLTESLGEMSSGLRESAQAAITSSSRLKGLTSTLMQSGGAFGRIGQTIRGFRFDLERTGSFTESLKSSFAGMPSSVQKAGSALKSAGSIMGNLMIGRIGPLTSALGALKTQKLANAAATILQTNTVGALSSKLAAQSGIVGALGSAFAAFRANLLATKSVTTALKVGFLKLQSVTKGTGAAMGFLSSMSGALSAIFGVLSGSTSVVAAVQASYSAIVAALAAAKASLAVITGVLIGLFTSLATIVGILAGAFLVVLAVVGTFAAALMSLGDSGESAGEMIDGLISTLKSIGQALMPAVVDAGNMMLNVFKSIMAPVDALISGVKEIGMALGLINEKQAGAGPMAILKGLVGLVEPITEKISDLAFMFGNFLTKHINTAVDAILTFVKDNNIAEQIDFYVGKLRSLGKQVLGLAGPIKDFLNEMIGVIGPVVSRAIDGVLGLVDAFFGLFGATGGGGFQNIISAFFGLYDVIIGLVEPALNIVGSIVKALAGLFDVAFGIIVGAVHLVIDAIGGVIDIFGAFMDGLLGGGGGGDGGGIFSTIAGFIPPIMNGIAMLIDGLTLIGDVVVSALAPFVGVLKDVGSFIIDLIIPYVRYLGSIIGYVFNTAVMIVKGVVSTIIGYFQGIIGFWQKIFSGKFLAAFGGLIKGVGEFFSGIVGFIINRLKTLAKIVAEFIGGVLGTIWDAFTSLPSALASLFADIGKGLADALVNAVGGITLIPEISGLGSSIPGFDGIDFGPIKLGEERSSSGSGGESSDGSGESDSQQPALQSENRADNGEEALVSGGATVANVGKEGASFMSGMMGGGGDVNVEEGDTRNIFNQTISADPEDEVQMGRIAEDAMAEANSFKRRQQGSQ